MKLIGVLIIRIFTFIVASMVYWDIYPQYHEFCIKWFMLVAVAMLADVIRKMVVHYREKESS